VAVRPLSYTGFPAARGTASAAPRKRPALLGARWFARDLAIVLGVIGAYFLLRGSAPDRIEFSVNVTNALIAFERELGIFWEPQIQQWSIQSHWVKELANFVYAYLHFPVLGAVAIWLWFKNRQSFLFMRNVMFVSMLFGLVFYYAVPAAPPRLMELHGYELGFVDTVFGTDTSVNYAQPSLILNEYAAIPSFHFGWIALASAAIWVNTRSYTLRAMAVMLTVLMTWAIVASANHLFVDMALGGLVIVASWWIATHHERRRRTRLI
jgi:hypothetical protein